MRYLSSKSEDQIEYYLKLSRRPVAGKKFSKYKGITSNPNLNKPYRASLTFMGRRLFIGTFATEIEAAMAWNEVALRVIGERALLNVFDDTNE